MQWLDSLHAQLPQLKEHKILLNSALANADKEFSGLAQLKSKVLLIAQNGPQHFLNAIYAVDTADINKSIDCAACLLTAKPYYFKDLKVFSKEVASLDEVCDGLEGAIVVGDDIFFTVEAQTFVCYVVKGTLEKGGSIKLASHLDIRKPADLANAGFESICYDPSPKRPIVFFERNRESKERTLVSFITTFANDRYESFGSLLFFRLTDDSYPAGATYRLLAIQHHYNMLPKELTFYVGSDLIAASRQIEGRDPQRTPYTRIITLSPGKNGWTFEPIARIGYTPQNWEGILHYRNGIPLITDAQGGSTALAFFELPEPRKQKK